MGIGYTRQSAADIVDGLPITSAPLNNEFNAIKDAFDGSSGHSHDGTLGEGQQIKLTSSVSGILPVDNGGTGSGSITGARANLLLTPGVNVQAYDAGLASIAALTTTANQMIYTTTLDTYATTSLTPFARTFLDDVDAQAVRTTLVIPGLATSNVWTGTLNNFSGNIISTGASADGLYYFSRTGTGASGGSVGALSGSIGLTSDNTLPIVFNVNGSERARINTSGYLGNATITGGSITDITDLAIADGGTGASTAGSARNNLGLGSMATQDRSAVLITGGSIGGIDDLAISDGGTGASTAAAARTNLGFGTLGTAGLSLLSSSTVADAQTTLNLRGPSVSLADDTLQSFPASSFPGVTTGAMLFVIPNNLNAGNGIAYFKTGGTSPQIQSIAGNGFQTVIGLPTVAGSVDGSVTIGVNNADGIVRVVNRSGNTYTYSLMYIPA